MMAMISSTALFRTQVELAEAHRHQLCEELREQHQRQQSGDEREQYQPIHCRRLSKQALKTKPRAPQSAHSNRSPSTPTPLSD
jgi:hypothetical protein